MLYPNKKLIKSKKVHYFNQWIATFGVLMLVLQIGINNGWSSPNLARLGTKDSPIPLTADQVSWVASLTSLGGFGGAIIGAVCIEYIGSKKSILVVLSLMSISWICLIIANSVEWLYLARIIAGAASFMTFGSFSVYLGEVSATKTRGTLISIAACGLPLGAVVSSVAETYLEMKVSSSIYLAVCLAAIVLFLWISDSPYYLMRKGDFEGARKSINLYFSGYEVDQNFDAIKKFVEAVGSQSMKEKFRELKVPAITKSMILIGILFILPRLSGMISLSSYMETILTNAKFDLVEPKDFVIYVSFIVFVASFLTVNLIGKFGRRLLLIISGIGTSMGMIGLGVLFYLLKMEVDSESTRWLAVFSILMYLIAYLVGFISVPSTVLSEIFPENLKSVAVIVALSAASLGAFLVSKAYKPLVDLVGEMYVFWIHAGLSFMAIPIAIFVLPETKGKTFQEIQNMIRR